MTILRPLRFISNRSGMLNGRRPAGRAGRVDIGGSLAPAGERSAALGGPRPPVPSIATTTHRPAPYGVTDSTPSGHRSQPFLIGGGSSGTTVAHLSTRSGAPRDQHHVVDQPGPADHGGDRHDRRSGH